jgi:hypothetical protein
MKTTKRKDKKMMRVFCNWIDTESPVFLEWLDYGFDDVAFLSVHAKRVGIGRKTAWESSRKILKCRNPKVDEKKLREWFQDCYEFETTDLRWREEYFKRKKNEKVMMQSFTFSDPELMKCLKTEL